MTESILTYFQNVRKIGPSKHKVRCPVPGHGQGRGDKHPSLEISELNDKWLISCRTGCSPDDIVAAAGLELQDLFKDNGNGASSKTSTRPAIKKFSPNELAARIAFTDDEPDPLPPPLENVPPLDAGIIPEPLRLWLTDIADSMQCPVEYPAIAALTALGAVIGNLVVVKPKARAGWIEVPNLWGAVVGDPGVMKSPAVSEALRFIKEIEKEKAADFESAKLENAFEKESREAQKKEIRRQLEQYHKPAPPNTPDGDRVDKDVLKKRFMELEAIPDIKQTRLWTSDATIEKLGELLKENPRGLFNIRDELAGVFANFDKQGREGERTFFLEAWTGRDSNNVDRMTRAIHVANLTLSIFGTIQPAIIEPLLHNTKKADGLSQRFQLLVYPDILPDYKYTDRPPQGVDNARKIFTRLYNLDAEKFDRLTDDAGGFHFMQFDDEAQEFFIEWFTDLNLRLRRDDFGSMALKAHISKYSGLMPSLALIFQLVENVGGVDDGKRISLKNAKLAAVWCSFLEKHARRLYGMAINSEYTVARLILEHLQSGRLPNEFSVRSVYRKHWSGLTSLPELKAGIEVLEEYGWIFERRGETAAGRPKIEYVAHEKVGK